ncbi:MAG TPA: sugar isomerase [Sumerlaeia bacterium]|nr:sugar isomerase [Sumerlaeia bacterium]
MTEANHAFPQTGRVACCPRGDQRPTDTGLSRRQFLEGVGGVALAGVALTGCSWSALSIHKPETPAAPARRPLTVKPILLYSTYTARAQTSWRSWGGIQTQQQADEEAGRIQGELAALESAADFPVRFLPLAAIRGRAELASIGDVASADALLVYAAGTGTGDLNAIADLKKDTVFFVRHRSGPVYLWYEIISPRFLRQHTDEQVVAGITAQDVVVDSQDEILWRLRSLCGLQNTVGSRILAVGGPGAWAQPRGLVPQLVRERWRLDIRTISYKDLGQLIGEARKDQRAVARARQRAGAYLRLPRTQLETQKPFVENAFLLEQVFVALMQEADCKAITINGCMGTIMPIAETSACLTLSLLNDARYLAFCESDFVVIPSGILMGSISGRPTFLNDPTFPHDGVITLAHCTAPRRMNGKDLEPVRILTHFESDYGAAPKVEMRKGQTVTMVAPDFAAERWVGLKGEIVDSPFLPICRSQIDVRFQCDSALLAERMPGFHWMLVYGDYCREIGYALRRIPIEWERL